MAASASELGWVVHFAPVVRFTPLSPIGDLRSGQFRDLPIPVGKSIWKKLKYLQYLSDQFKSFRTMLN